MCYNRQAVGGTITVWNRITQEAWMFMKEISSDGDVSTVSTHKLKWSLYILYGLKFLRDPILLLLRVSTNHENI